jgi:hypothetical protein
VKVVVITEGPSAVRRAVFKGDIAQRRTVVRQAERFGFAPPIYTPAQWEEFKAKLQRDEREFEIEFGEKP